MSDMQMVETQELTPLPGRHCAGCTACCSFAPIHADTLQKPANTLCDHCAEGQGCTVYDMRPTVCRTFFCGWFFLPELGENWHPEQSGIVIRSEDAGMDTITLLILEITDFLVSEDFAGMVAAWVDAGIGVEFERLGPPGYLPAKMRVNELLEEAVAARDLVAMQQMFAWSLGHIEHSHVWERDQTVPFTALG